MAYVNHQKHNEKSQKNAWDVQDLKNYSRNTKKWNDSKSLEQVGGHEYPPRSIILM